MATDFNHLLRSAGCFKYVSIEGETCQSSCVLAAGTKLTTIIHQGQTFLKDYHKSHNHSLQK